MLTKIYAFVAALLISLGVAVKVLMGRNKALKKEVQVGEKKYKIRVEQDDAKAEVQEDEPQKISEIVEDGRGSSRADRLNSVLNDSDS